MVYVTKEITFDAAHMLDGYEGKCRNLHGHTYRLEVVLCGEPDMNGMTFDFGMIKSEMLKRVVAVFDHAFIYNVNSRSERELGEFLELRGHRTAALPFRTTSENLARHIFDLLAATLPVSEVRLHETPTSCASCKHGFRT